jgi:ribosomal protein S18 acetylase RimI-like enzyme
LKEEATLAEDITLRTLTLADYDRWMAIWQEAGLHSIRPHGRDSRQAFARQLDSGTHTMLGLELSGELIGVVLATHDGRKGWINRLAIRPEYRRQGYAARLVAEAERVLHEQGISIIAALIETGNDASLTLFRKLGYSELPDGIHYVSKRDSAEV